MVFSSCKKDSSFMLVLLPDTQNYSAGHPEIFMSQTSWIADHAKEIAFVLQQGDITNNNIEAQWKVAADAFSLIDGLVPYTFVAGNHDMGNNGKTDNRNTDLFNYYFPYEKYSRSTSLKGIYEPDCMDNTFHIFRAGGINWLVLSLEFGPRDEVLSWASNIVEEHPKHKVIINTHAYMYSDDTRMGEGKGHNWLPQKYGIGKDTLSGSVNDGEQMWEKLVKKYSNILLVFSGHVLNDGTGLLVSKGDHGNKVYQMLANYQSGVEGSENGGDGFLRMVSIDTKNSIISVKTYSPYLNQYRTSPDQEFIIDDVSFK
jgi:Calcineurin-like phosphoesterase